MIPDRDRGDFSYSVSIYVTTSYQLCVAWAGSEKRKKVKVRLLSSKNIYIYIFVSMIALQKWWKMKMIKALFVLKIFRFLSRLFGHVEKTAWLERYG